MSEKATAEVLGKRVRDLEQRLSEHRRTEALLRAEERKYRTIIDKAQEVIFIIQNGKIVFTNPKTWEFIGYQPQELEKLSFLDIVHPKDRPWAIDQYTRKMAGETLPRGLPYRVVSKDGNTHWVQSRSTVIEWDGQPAFLSYMIDVTPLKTAEQALRRSEERLQKLIRHSNDLIVIIDENGRERYVSESVERLTGFKAEQYIGHSGFDYLHPDDVAHMAEIMKQTIENPELPIRTEYRHRHRDGSWVHLAAIGTNFLHDPSIQGIVLNIRDITARKHREQALKESEERFRDLLERLENIPIQGFDANQRIVYWNAASTVVYGYSREQALGSRIEDLIIPEHLRDEFVTGINQWIADGPPIPSGERILVDQQGNDVPVYVSHIMHVTARGDKEMFCVNVDLRMLRRAEGQLRRLVTAIEQAGDAIVITDSAGAIQYVNPAFERVTGYTRSEAIGRNPKILNSGLQDDDFYRTMWATITSGQTWKGRIVNKRKDGSLYTEEASISPVVNASEAIVNYVAVKRDITGYLRIESEKARIEDQYRQAQKVEAIGRLAGGVAHDLNNLLSPILGYGEILMDEFAPNDRRRRSVSEIVRAGCRARDLVRQLLAFSRKQTLEYKPLDMNDTLKGFEKLMRRTIREDIAIEIIPSPGIPTVLADIGQIEQVIMNLTVNAQDAMPKGGRLTLETARVQIDEAFAKTRRGLEPGDYVGLSVKDSGCGMGAETQKHIFEPFFSTKGEHGTGLGLATVYGIVKQHGGYIWFDSEPQRGTTFQVYLPVTEKTGLGEATGGQAVGNQKGLETILIVEDNEQVRDLAQAILVRQGYTVILAAGGPEALAALNSHKSGAHLMLTDVVMPEMHGKELYERAVKGYPHLKVLYMSGYTDDVIAYRGVLETGTAFIQKPFTVQGLATKVREVLDR